MVKGKTSSGFAYAIPESRFNNLELLKTYRRVADPKSTADQYAALDIPRLLLGEEQEQKLYEHLRKEDPELPFDLVTREIQEIQAANTQTKNSSSSPK